MPSRILNFHAIESFFFREAKPTQLLVIGSQKINFYALFNNVTVRGLPVRVEQATWEGKWIVFSFSPRF